MSRLHPEIARRIREALANHERTTMSADARRLANAALRAAKDSAQKEAPMAVEAVSDRPAKGIAGDSHDG